MTWRAIAADLRRRILSGELAAGERVPTEAQIAETPDKGGMGVSRTTARRALAELRSEGLIEVQGYRGTVVTAREPQQPVTLGPGDRAITRMPTPAERAEHGLGEGEPVIEVRRAGGAVELHGGRTAYLTA